MGDANPKTGGGKRIRPTNVRLSASRPYARIMSPGMRHVKRRRRPTFVRNRDRKYWREEEPVAVGGIERRIYACVHVAA